MKWLDFGIAVNFDEPFSCNNCDLDYQCDDKLMIFGDSSFFVRLMMVALEIF